MFPNNPQGLPVDPVNVNEQGFLRQMPNLPPLQLGRMQQLATPIVSAAIQEVQNHARQNPLRTFLFNLVSQNGWVNETFERLLGTIARFAEFLINTKQMPPEQAVQVATTEVCTMLTSVMVDKYPALQQIAFPAHQAEIQRHIQNFIGLQQDLDQFERAMQSRQQQPQTGWGQQPTGWGQPATGSGWGPQPARGTGWSNNPGPATGWGGGQPAGWGNRPAMGQPQAAHGNTGQFRSRSDAMWNSGQGAAAPQQDFHSVGAGFNSGIHSMNTKPREEVTMGPTNNAQDFPRAPSQKQPTSTTFIPPAPQSNTAWYPVSKDSEWPKVKDPKRPYDAILFEDGSELRPMVFSHWVVSKTDDRPTGLVYDRSTHVMFHLRKADGTVIETIKKKTPDMDYLDNELDPTLRDSFKKKQAQISGGKVVPNAELLSSFRSLQRNTAVPVSPEDISEDELENGEAQTVLEPIQASSEGDANTRAHLLAAVANDGDVDAVEYVCDKTTTVKGQAAMINVIKDLSRSSNYPYFISSLIEAQSEERINGPIYDYLKKAVTEGVNTVLSHDLLLEGWTIDSVLGDFEDLVKLLRERFGEQAVKVLEASAVKVIPAACHVLAGDDLSRYLKTLNLGENTEEATKRMVVFTHRSAVTEVPWSLEDFKTRYQLEGVVTADAAPKLHDACIALMERSKASEPLTHRYLVTCDKQKIDVRVSPFAANSFLLKVDGAL